MTTRGKCDIEGKYTPSVAYCCLYCKVFRDINKCGHAQANLDALPPNEPSYLTAAVGPPRTTAPRHFCSVCGNFSSCAPASLMSHCMDPACVARALEYEARREKGSCFADEYESRVVEGCDDMRW